MLELLAPAGSMDALRAAVQNGANAVYLGCGTFNARQSAKNFTTQTLTEAVKYCHIRGVKVHLTLNTLVSDRESHELIELIRHAANTGVDAFIVQDLGVAELCRQIAPQVALHGSTQMTIHNLAGVQLCAAMGMSRVVLSRELNREEIQYICANSPIEIEVFAHGALCMCYSGQCYMSALIGGRSGNRGRCAQPCRQSYGYAHWEEKYPLSLKDNCLVHYLQEMEEMGVASVKLEGRMKKPEYVATVTAVYRKALDEANVTKPMMEALMTAFNRQGFTDGYYTGRVDRKMFGVREDTKMGFIIPGNIFRSGVGYHADHTAFFLLPANDPLDTGVGGGNMAAHILFPALVLFFQFFVCKVIPLLAHTHKTRMKTAFDIFIQSDGSAGAELVQYVAEIRIIDSRFTLYHRIIVIQNQTGILQHIIPPFL